MLILQWSRFAMSHSHHRICHTVAGNVRNAAKTNTTEVIRGFSMRIGARCANGSTLLSPSLFFDRRLSFQALIPGRHARRCISPHFQPITAMGKAVTSPLASRQTHNVSQSGWRDGGRGWFRNVQNYHPSAIEDVAETAASGSASALPLC